MSKKLIYLTSFVLVLSLAGKGWSHASMPIPTDGAIHEDTWMSLSWRPGDHAVSHDIYFGENYDDVKYGTGGTFQGNQSTAFFIVGFPGFPYPDGLVPGTTYYWRIDEINDQHPDSPWEGDVWSFMVLSSTAYAPEPADGAKFIDADVTLSWQPGYRAKLHTVYFGDNFAEVNNASGGLPMGIPTYTPGHLELGKTYYWRVDEFDGTSTYKGDVWSFTVGAGIPPDVVGGTIYVDADATGNNDGSSWSNAYLCLQDALAGARYGDEIRVANGVYRPDQRAMMRRDQIQIVSSGDWTATFQLIDGVAISGGYAGFGEPNPDARDVDQYESVLSGDLKGDDGPEFTNTWDNCYQVVTASGTQWTAVLDGFTITGGNADGPFPYDHGGGIYNVEGSPMLIDCTFGGNSTTGNGGGMYNSFYSDPTLIDCTFNSNTATHGGGMFNDNSDPALLNCILAGNSAGMGGGMYNRQSDPPLTNCTFSENSAGGGGGGGMYNEGSVPMLADCFFTGNSTTGSGGGMYNNSSDPMLLSCLFRTNSAPRSGGGMYNRYTSQPYLANCIFSGNSARNGGGMENLNTSQPILVNCTFSANFAENASGGISNIQDSQLTLINCILWGDIPDEIRGSAYVSYSDIEGGWSDIGMNNLDIAPLFADPENGDYHLKSQAGRWNPTGQGWVIDPISSPCIDAGDPSILVGLERFPNGSRINIGAYGSTPEASLSPSEQQCPSPMPNKALDPYPADGAVDVGAHVDLVILTWTAGLNAVYHDVYLGIDRDAVANADTSSDTTGTYRGRQIITSHMPVDVGPRTTPYYWRIDEVDSQGNKTRGDVWTFTTIPPLPGKASHPIPADGAVAVFVHFDPVTLSWTAGLNTVSHDIYFGTGDSMSFVGNQAATQFNLGILNVGVTYYWRIDEVDSQGNKTRGDVWTFTAIPPLSARASNPIPADGTISVDRNVTLSWTPGFDAASHNLYLGIEFDHVDPSNANIVPVSVSQIRTSYDPGILEYGQTYYWRVDEVDAQGMIITGDVWSFTTVSSTAHPKGRACFTGNTPVWINGTLTLISKVCNGQVMRDIDGHSKIEEVQEHTGMFACYDIVLESGNCITVAECHYFMTESGRWIALHNLKTGTRLKTSKGAVKVITITKRPIPYIGKVFNLKVDGSDRYLVGKDAVVVRDY